MTENPTAAPAGAHPVRVEGARDPVLSQRRAATLFGCSRRGRAPARRRSTVFVWDVITVILKAIAVGFVLLVVLGMTGYGMFS